MSVHVHARQIKPFRAQRPPLVPSFLVLLALGNPPSVSESKGRCFALLGKLSLAGLIAEKRYTMNWQNLNRGVGEGLGVSLENTLCGMHAFPSLSPSVTKSKRVAIVVVHLLSTVYFSSFYSMTICKRVLQCSSIQSESVGQYT